MKLSQFLFFNVLLDISEIRCCSRFKDRLISINRRTHTYRKSNGIRGSGINVVVFSFRGNDFQLREKGCSGDTNDSHAFKVCLKCVKDRTHKIVSKGAALRCLVNSKTD